jgi:two-component system CheB/CheR fusion protein
MLGHDRERPATMSTTEDAASKLHDTAASQGFLVVGLGASAGGIPALSTFFRNVPPDSGMAYVVILHLSPDHDSQLANVLQNVSQIPVRQVTEPVTVQPDHVYVVPPDRHLMLSSDTLAAIPNISMQERRAPVDIFFRTLGDCMGRRAACIVLSGTGADGSMGIKRVKEHGGAVFAQMPSEAQFDEMPRHTLATGLVDETLPVAMMPAALAAYQKHIRSVRIDGDEDPQEQQQHALRELFTTMRTRTGHDFTNYKRPTLLRRIERRMAVRNTPELVGYVTLVRDDPAEAQALLKDLLISVTSFFRDGNAWGFIEREVVPRIVRSKTGQEPIRVWSAACATGEEAYSLAILLSEAVSEMVDTPKIQIFATDIDDRAIAHAREALYTMNDAADVSPARLARFFTEEVGGYRVRREIREMVMFASHNLIKDPPFSHLDLVVCRNLLIYLNPSAQERVLSTFHFALNPGGYLFIGSSESVEGSGDLFATVSSEQHIYQSRQTGLRNYPLPEPGQSVATLPSRLPAIAKTEGQRLDRISYGELHQQLLELYAPPSLVVNEDYDIVHMSARAGQYLHVSGGEPTPNLLKLVRDELRLELRSALFQAARRQSPVDVQGLRVRGSDGEETVDIHVRPVFHAEDPARGFILIVFEPSAGGAAAEPTVYRSDEPVARQLEAELARVRLQLRTSNEQHEIQAEEQKASNEELQAINEELRSSAEELETSKEELQSMNEELTTVNQELKVKIDELAHATSDLRNLINSTNIPTLFLDRAMHVKLFTPNARDLFNLIPADIGRPLSDITAKINYDRLVDDARVVLQSLQSLEREVRSNDERTYLMRVLPYRTAEDRINGVVVTFIEITERKRAQDELAGARTQLESRVEERTRELEHANRALRNEAHERDLAEQGRIALTRQLANAQEAERRRISRELHDQLGQQVSALVLKLSMLRDATTLPPRAREEIERLEAIARRLDADLDFLVWQLRPTALDDLGLQEALSDYIESWARHYNLQVETDLKGPGGNAVEPDVETVLYRTAQEALNNIAKHSGATEVRVALERKANEVVLSVHDNGRGFEPKKAIAGSGGLGLVGMRERVTLVGGSCDIESRPGHGTTVWIRVPMKAS